MKTDVLLCETLVLFLLDFAALLDFRPAISDAVYMETRDEGAQVEHNRTKSIRPHSADAGPFAGNWAAAGNVVFALVAEAAPALADTVGGFLSPNEVGGLDIPDERHAEFYRVFAAALVREASTRSTADMLQIAKAFELLSTDSEAMNTLMDGIVEIITPHSEALRARQRFVELPVMGAA